MKNRLIRSVFRFMFKKSTNMIVYFARQPEITDLLVDPIEMYDIEYQ